ncbi:glycoside hydrolase family 13 protein [Weissella paramesenteroides]|uniref:glycoside hydrolase family 13 protein n=1 Tax=Weissella paramesenteroides TaxID=1249 RepID=UPI0023FA155E|nr:alpha-glucosidase [Weissella paramesenteroides]MDF8373890.1 alpha-glucosidase [Weissella paramesenteroides]WIG65523.1 alpha-glucosidase [Weissella paramesenteroides]
MSKEWWKEAVVYQIYPQSFKDTNNDGIGDLNGIKEKLPYLKKLGIDVIWLNPIYQSPMVDNGYDISDYYAISPEFGTMSNFDALIFEAKKQGIKIILDLAVCATSSEHQWFLESKKSVDNPYSDYYIWRDAKPDGSEPNNWGSIFGGGSAWKWDENRKQYYLHLFATEMPDLNWANPKVRQEVYKNMRFWLDKGVAGFRLDSISLISKNQDFPDTPDVPEGEFGSPYFGASNGPHVHEYLQEMNREVLSQYDGLMTVGEATRTPVEKAVLYTDPVRKELNMIFQFDHMHVDYGEYGRYSDLRFKLSDLKKSMVQWQDKLHEHGWNSLYWNNHDQPRTVSRFGNDSEEFREKSAKMLATVLHFQQGTPFIFQGEEIGMTNANFNKIEEYRDLESHNMYQKFSDMGLPEEKVLTFLKYKSRDNARTPMQWDNTVNGGFSSYEPWISTNKNYSQINVASDLANSESIFYYYQKLIRLRKELPVMVDGEFTPVQMEDSAVFAYTRALNNEKLLIVGSFSDKRIRFELPTEFLDDPEIIMNNYDKAVQQNGVLYLRPYEAVVYRIK